MALGARSTRVRCATGERASRKARLLTANATTADVAQNSGRSIDFLEKRKRLETKNPLIAPRKEF
jgi:hypothetical protein